MRVGTRGACSPEFGSAVAETALPLASDMLYMYDGGFLGWSDFEGLLNSVVNCAWDSDWEL